MKIGIDAGGTFTDLVAQKENNLFHIKVPSTPSHPDQAILKVLDLLAQKTDNTVFQSDIRHGTTVATNTLLEKKGANVVLISNKNFEDLFFLRRQARDNLYALHPQEPTPIIATKNILGIDGRIDPWGKVIRPLEELNDWHDNNKELFEKADAIAICLLHSYANPSHEQEIAKLLRKRYPKVFLTSSSDLAPLEREYERTTTVVANAYVAPKLETYISALSATLKEANLNIMGSAGGLLPVSRIIKEPVHSLVSGPAGGVRGAWLAGQRFGRKDLLSLDMGGTSTDIALVQGHLKPENETSVENLPLRIPFLPIETIGAGGGSIAFVDEGGTLRVGPKSAGADPGPAAYGKQTKNIQATVTDANVVLGRITTLLGGKMPIDKEAAKKSIAQLAEKLSSDIETTAESILEIAEANMVRACKRISLNHGVDPRGLTMVAFGGAGGLHACSLAEELEISEFIAPRESGLLSAEGVLQAPKETHLCENLEAQESDWGQIGLVKKIQVHSDTLKSKFVADFPEINLETTHAEIYLDCRYTGQTFTLTINLNETTQKLNPNPSQKDVLQDLVPNILYDSIKSAFAATHEQHFGYTLKENPIVLSSIRSVQRHLPSSSEEEQKSEVIERFTGPETISSYSSTVYLKNDWHAEKLSSGDLVCRHKPSPKRIKKQRQQNLSMEVYRQKLISIAEEMGATLMRASFSANIKERRDYSCAIFDGDGNLLTQAAHIPVHLGSQPLSVKAAIDSITMRPGIHIILNDPFAGGTHLPDITLVSPVYSQTNSSSKPDFYVANRAHHADVGGLEPGSMPAPIKSDGTFRKLTIDDEGWRIGPTILNENVRKDLASTSRTPQERYGDLRAQEAANNHGIKRLQETAKATEDFTGENKCLIDYAQNRMEALLKSIPDGEYSFEDSLDDGDHNKHSIKLKVKIKIQDCRAIIDLRDNPNAVDSSLNAVRAIVVSALTYAFCCLGGEELPANAGLMRPVEILTKPGTILDAQSPAAVSAGNVETAQRLVDLIYGAFAKALPEKIPAASCGTMNNILFGGIDNRKNKKSTFVHYETLGGGAGGGPQGPGADAIHTHMTNTLNTPVEALERHFPVQIDTYALRKQQKPKGNINSGGKGIVRQYQFLVPAQVTIISERRIHKPYGLNNAPDGQCGKNTLLKKDGSQVELAGKVSLTVQANEAIRIETPSGGCWRSPKK
ncbi:MAG: hydantoinase B/oxoprolinase family protein [Myxococcota bacterium]|nr:hydantoinase B/oxoprolinase family protein [Myxococcota bacterium]